MVTTQTNSILVIDDNPNNLRVLLDILHEAGFKVSVVKSGELALQQLPFIQPDLILLDIMMRGIDGFETCRRLKADKNTQNIPVIFMTVLSDLENKVKGLQLGAVDYITKPIQAEEVIARVKVHLELRNTQIQLNNEISKNQQNEQKFKRILDIAAEAIISIDEHQRIQIFNQGAQKIFGYLPEEVLGQPLDILLPEAFRQIHQQHVRHFATSQSSSRMMGERTNIFGRRKNGEQFPAEASISKLSLKDGLLFTVMLQDITIRKQTEHKLQLLNQLQLEKTQQLEAALLELQQAQFQLVQQEKMASLGQLVAGIAHEINNPVSFIYGNINPALEYAQELLSLLELYQQHYPEPVAEIAQQLELVELDFIAVDFPKLLSSMQEGSKRIFSIIKSLKNFSHQYEGKPQLVDIHQGIDSTLLILQHRLKQRFGRSEIKLKKEYGELPLVKCYPDQLNQVFMNLLSNAIDALEISIDNTNTEKDSLNNSQSSKSNLPIIVISTQVVDGSSPKVVIRIIDNGSGISPSLQGRIFDPFFTTKPLGKGTGLGLAISYRIVVEQHQGQMHCLSTPGEGTEFVIELPLVAQ